MRFRYILTVLLLTLLPMLLCASGKQNYAIDPKSFVKDIDEALLTESPETLVKNATKYLVSNRQKNIPNCFGCSFYLIKSTMDSDPAIQLAAVDLAEKFSPNDLVEVHSHYLARLIIHAPFEVGKIFHELGAVIKGSLDAPFGDALVYTFLSDLLSCTTIILWIFILLMSFKHPSLIRHRYRHLFGFSKFYSIAFLVALVITGYVLIRSFQQALFLYIPLIVFLCNVVTRKERFILNFIFFFYLLFAGSQILLVNNKEFKNDPDIAYNNFNAIYSPDLLEGEIDEKTPGGAIAKGFSYFYQGNYSRAVFYLKKGLSDETDPEIAVALRNVIGVSLASYGKQKEGAEYLKAAYDASGDISIGYNLVRVLQEAQIDPDEASIPAELKRPVGFAELVYPFVKIPSSSAVWRYLCYGDDLSYRENRAKFLIFVLSLLLYALFIHAITVSYLNRLKVSRCEECGAVICTKCNPGITDVCAVCKLMKADSSLFKRGEREIYEARRYSYLRRRTIFFYIFTFLIPGGGLITVNRTLEGFAYLGTFVLIAYFRLVSSLEPAIKHPLQVGFVAATTAVLLALIYLTAAARSFIVERR